VIQAAGRGVGAPPRRAGHPFRDRREAGDALGKVLAARYGDRSDVVVLGLPRGGVPVALEVARALDAPLDVFVVRKLGVPGYPELAMGAIASGGVRVTNDVAGRLGVSPAAVEEVVAAEQRELARREALYRGRAAERDVAGRTVILVDDGAATGSSMEAAVRALRRRGPRAVVVAVPVASASALRALGRLADDVAVVAVPEPFLAVGNAYVDFAEVPDEAVRLLLSLAAEGGRPTSKGAT
jgi:predicted phosphoribosyltransferase